MTDLVKAHRKIVILTFPPEVSGRPVISNLTRLYDLNCNILKAHITPRKEGYMTLEMSGSLENYNKGVAYLKDQGLRIKDAAQTVSRDEASCMHCGMCTAICPTDALRLDLVRRLVIFDKERCSACSLCIRVCPVKAMQAELDN